MSYQTGIDNLNLSYFEEAGILGGSTGMAPIVLSSNSSFPALSDNYGAAPTLTANLLQYGAGGGAVWAGWDFAAKSKVLIINGISQGTASDQYYLISDSPCDSSNMWGTTDAYLGQVAHASSKITDLTSGAFTVLATSSSLTSLPADAGNPSFNTALYVTDGVQKLYVQNGSANWVNILSTTDDGHTSFESVIVWMYENAGPRLVGPQFQVWGA